MGTTGENDVTPTGTGSEGANARGSETLHAGSSFQEAIPSRLKVNGSEENDETDCRRDSKDAGNLADYPLEDKSTSDEEGHAPEGQIGYPDENEGASVGSGRHSNGSERESSESSCDPDEEKNEYDGDKTDFNDVRSKEDGEKRDASQVDRNHSDGSEDQDSVRRVLVEEDDADPEVVSMTSNGATSRRSPEGSPSHSPGGTPLPKHVQFEEDYNGADKQLLPEVDPDQTGSDDGYSNVDAVDRPSSADVRSTTPPGAAGSNGDAMGVASVPSHDRRLMKIGMEDGGKGSRMSGDVKWMCCCGMSWSTVGAVAMCAGIMLVVHLRGFWKDASHPDERLLLYFGIGCCIFGVLTLLVGFGFWTWTCIVWDPFGQETDAERQVSDHNSGPSRKTKYVINNERVQSGPVVAMPEELVTHEQKTPSDPRRDETFLV